MTGTSELVPPNPVPRRPALGRVLAACAFLALAGCQSLDGKIARDVPPERLFAAGLETLDARYIEPVNLRVLSMAGLSRLSDIDPDISISDSRGWVVLKARGSQAGIWETPGPKDSRRWAKVIDGVIHAARRSSPTLGTRSTAALSDVVLRGVMGKLDKYSRYASPAAAERNRAMREGFGGLGITLRYDNGKARIDRVLPETPAAAAGLMAGDVITHVDGDSIAGLQPSQIVTRLRGHVDEPVELRLSRPGAAKSIDITVVRGRIVPPTVTARMMDGILTLRLSGFNEATADSMEEEIRKVELHSLRGIVLDLRGNPGGLLQEAVAVADLLLGEGQVISTRGRHPRSHQSFESGPEQLARGVPLAVLINGKSASAAEIVAAALHDRRRAVVLGSSSFGKGSVQTIITLPNRGEITVTWARMMTPSGNPLHHKGVVPAICTHGADRSVSALLKALMAGDQKSAHSSARALYPGRSGTRSLERARAACPPDKGESAQELEIARLLLGQGRLYQRLLTGHSHFVAANPDR